MAKSCGATQPGADRFSYPLFADPSGENEGVKPAEHSRERADFAHQSVYVELDRASRRSPLSGQQVADVVTDPGDPEQTAFMKQQSPKPRLVVALLAHQV